VRAADVAAKVRELTLQDAGHGSSSQGAKP
jgi:hypothetical protein